MRIRPWRAWAVGGLALALVGGGVAAAPAAFASTGTSPIPLQILAINDFHGNLEPPQGSTGSITTALSPTGVATTVPAGGAAYLATHLQQARVGHPNSITVSAGDLIGGSPLLSAAFHDEPTIEALKAMGLSVSAVGNHEFDEGKDELFRINAGGCHPTDGCRGSQPYQGAGFYLSANVIDTRRHRPILPPVSIRSINGARVGFIGVTLAGTPDIVSAAGVAGLRFQDEIKTVNTYARLLRRLGIQAIVALVHEGGDPASQVFNYNCDAGGPGQGLTGPIVDIAKGLDHSVDLILTAHTHQSYVCTIPDPAGEPRLVTSAASFGRLYTELTMNYDRRRHDIVRPSVAAHNVVVTRDVTPDPTVSGIIARYQTLIGPIASRVVGHISATIPGRGVSTPERPLGDVVADAQLAATASPATGGAVLGITNSGGLRADLAYPASGSEGDGTVTYAEAFAVQPFNNYLVTLDLTGAQLVTVLQQQFTGINAASPRYLQISAGLHWTADLSQVGAGRVVAGSVTVNGVPLSPTASYRITVNSFLAGGGDGFTGFTGGTNRLVGELDIDAFVDYLTANGTATTPLAPPASTRISFV